MKYVKGLCLVRHTPADRHVAELNARALLDSLLSPKQRKELHDHMRITIRPARRWQPIYQIGVSRGTLYAKRQRMFTEDYLCVSPRSSEWLPVSDSLLTMFAWIVGDRKEFDRIANVVSMAGREF